MPGLFSVPPPFYYFPHADPTLSELRRIRRVASTTGLSRMDKELAQTTTVFANEQQIAAHADACYIGFKKTIDRKASARGLLALLFNKP